MVKDKMGQARLQGVMRGGWMMQVGLKGVKRCAGLLMGLVWVVVVPQVQADAGAQLTASLETEREHYAGIAFKIWDYAELGYQETRSSQLLQDTLADEGFEVKVGVAEIPTAFVASFGQGEPVIGILAEFDALPGISQAAVPTRSVLADKTAGHACGHHLFGAGSTAAAIAVSYTHLTLPTSDLV